MIWLNDIWSDWWNWMSAMSVQATMLVVVVLLLERLLSRWAGPRLLAALWYVVMAKLLVPPTISTPLSLSRLVSGSVGAISPAGISEFSTWGAVGFFVWLFGVVMFGVGLGWRHRRVKRRWLADGPIDPPEWIEVMKSVAATRLSLGRMPIVQIHANAGGAAVVGFFRPIVVLPQSVLFDGPCNEVEHMLLHEFAHVKRRDPLAAWLCLVVQVLYWFHPCVWLTRSKLAAWREICCDEAVVMALGRQSRCYRETLLSAGRQLLAPAPTGHLAFIPRQSQLITRLEWLDRQPSQRSMLAALAVIFVAVCWAPMGPALQAISTADSPSSTAGCMRLRYQVFQALALQESQSVEIFPTS